MKKLYFAKVSATISKWIENNANLEYKFWISDAEVPRNPQVEVETQLVWPKIEFSWQKWFEIVEIIFKLSFYKYQLNS